ncbi:hypothetical protein AURANDRAFT_26920 [Aureococcus anophagefferens]|uniref:Sel1 repeat family protein n=1 Tax=Aureococcus anophagefferens TaxID=44056 RepID=F0Y9Y1_AURAN|nr:hypothetical protein AURANDRAFT_26920 [Aureococcus anophagefferens]EGB07834.1 hypothetical protein AURANDRAFT_26920 [Aureococcus anophagefferens]|eukprot:XP_009037214.1 hypothetical protein AURANDRAFT_26920 [Aureococcus anophagefferens]
MLRICCCRTVCESCQDKIGTGACPLCRLPCPKNEAEDLARLRRHVENEVPEAITHLGDSYQEGWYGLVKSDKKAAKIWKRAVELGDVEAMVSLGELHQRGSAVKLDKEKAERLFRMAADRGDACAQSSLGLLLHSEEKHEEAFRYVALAADQGRTSAESNLGVCYRDGEGTEVDLGKARYWFERAAAKGSEQATKNLARLDAQKAAKIYRRAVELGDVDAMIFLGEFYEHGSGVKLDKKKAERLYRAAADRGDAAAQNNSGILLYHEKKFEEAFRYVALAADQGLTAGENSLGVAYHQGLFGLVTSDKKAAKIWKRAVELGSVEAMTKLGELYENGSGVKLDKKKAERLYRMAADRGDAPGENNLGCCYQHGEGTEVDLGKARYWLERAAAKGHERAIENLADLDAQVY